MMACVDVDYRDKGAVAACVVFARWQDREPVARYVERIPTVLPYVAGHFYRRELPCLLAVLEQVREPLDVVIVDGYVWLDGEGDPGLGAHLYEALSRKVVVIGVAKSLYQRSPAQPVCRGDSRQPLYVTAAGLDGDEAARLVREMEGPFRIPALLGEADRLCRQAK
jgi:deoxyribonuclease V